MGKLVDQKITKFILNIFPEMFPVYYDVLSCNFELLISASPMNDWYWLFAFYWDYKGNNNFVNFIPSTPVESDNLNEKELLNITFSYFHSVSAIS